MTPAPQPLDLNADIGESFGRWTLGDDRAVLDSVSSANIACGFHAGDPRTIAETCRLAAEADVRIGAHVAYRDLAGFGRRFLDCSESELAADVLYQIGALDALAHAHGARVSYLKPHGALYNAIVHHESHARAVVAALGAFSRALPLLVLPGSTIADLAHEAGLTVVTEAFADRAYRPDGTLAPRHEPGAVLTDATAIAERVVRLATAREITAIDGTTITVEAASVCLHGDTPGAVATAAAVRSALGSAGVDVRPFV